MKATGARSDRGLALLKLLLEAPGDMEAWWRFMEALSQAISPDVKAFVVAEQTVPAPITIAFGDGVQQAVPRTLERSHPLRRGLTLPPGSVFEIPASREADPFGVFEGLLGAEGQTAGTIIGVTMDRTAPGHSACVVVPTKAGWKPRAVDRALIGRIAPFLPIASQLHQRLIGASAFTSILDYLVLGVILLDDQGRVSYANRSAAEMYGIEPGLSDPAERAGRDPRTDALYRTIRRANAPAASTGKRPLHVLATPLTWPNPHGNPARRFSSALFIGDPSRRHTGEPMKALAELYGLTAAETRLAWLLVGDRTVNQAAVQLGITPETARTVLKRILAKTGTRRQTSLVRLLLSGPGQVRADAKAEPHHPLIKPSRRKRGR